MLLLGKCRYGKLIPAFVFVYEEDNHVIEDERQSAEGRHSSEPEKAHATDKFVTVV